MADRDLKLSRRTILTAGAAAFVTTLLPALPSRAREKSKIRDIYVGRRGTTIWMDLESAPFPTKGSRWTDPTVIVFVPHYFRIRADYKIDVVMHLHGYRDTADAAMKRHQLREQLFDSKQNAIIVFPQGPVNAESMDYGKLDQPRGLLALLTELRKTLQTPRVQAKLGPAGIPNRARIGTLVMSAHSGGFKGVSNCLAHGGWDVSEVYLFDALYGQTGIFRDWLVETWKKSIPEGDRHKLVSYFGDEPTIVESRRLMRELERLKIPYVLEQKEGEMTRRQMTKSRAVFIQRSTSHQGVLWRTNALRDCLYASGLRRYVDSKWFEHAENPRDITHRDPE